MKESKKIIDTIVFDVGSTYTKITAFAEQLGELQWLARAQAPTTVQDIDEGLTQAVAELSKTLQLDEINPRHVLSTSSAAGGLRMVAMGYMPRVTAKAAKEVAMNAGARVLEVMSFEDHPENKQEMLCEIRPDIILLAGGTDGGDKASLLADTQIIAASGIKATVVIAGNIDAQPEAEAILMRSGLHTVRVPNVMPNIHNLNVKPAREVIHEQFIHQITKAKGLNQLLARLTVNKVVPTPGAVLMAAELLAKGTHEEKGCGSIVVVDLGGATTDIHSVLPYLDELSIEERGLVLTNEKQAAFRTVEGNLGLRVSARGIVEAIGIKGILARIGLSGEEKEQELAAYVANLEANPGQLALSCQERLFDTGLAEAALEVALKRHAGYIAQQFDPVMGIIPGTPVGRDLRTVETVIAIGGIFVHLSEEDAKTIVAKSLARPEFSLLPANPKVVIDRNYLVYAIGLLAQYRPTAALRFAKKHFGLSN
jgi:uncharacterized protein (TIGR01319 family)